MTESPRKNLYDQSVNIIQFAHPLCTLHSRQSNSHFTDKPILVHRSPLLPTAIPWGLCPHLLHVLEHHVTMPIEGLDTREQLSVVAAGDEDLGVGFHSRLEDRERAGCKFVLFELGDLKLTVNRTLACGLFGMSSMGKVETYVSSLRGLARSSL